MKEYAVYNGHGVKQIGVYNTLDLALGVAQSMNTHPARASQTYYGAECDLESLVNQMLCEHGEIRDLREKLRQAEKRHELLGAQLQQLREATSQCPDRAADMQGVAASLGDEDVGYDPPDWVPGASPEVNALVSFLRRREESLEQFDQRVKEGLQQLHAGNPKFDKEWSL